MKEIKDKVFGELKFRYGWKKEEKLNLWGKEYSVQCTIYIGEDEEISEKARESYKSYKEVEKKIDKILEEHISEIDRDILDAKEKMRPMTIAFYNNGDSGVIFECDWDLDNGVALLLTPEIKIVNNDDLL